MKSMKKFKMVFLSNQSQKVSHQILIRKIMD